MLRNCKKLLFALSTALFQHNPLSLQHQQLIRFPLFFFLPFSSLFLSKANSTSTGQLDKLVSPGLAPESAEERSLPPQRVSTFRPRPYSMADSNRVGHMTPLGGGQECQRICDKDSVGSVKLSV